MTKSLSIELENVARWLENGCDVSHAARELRLMAAEQRATLEPSCVDSFPSPLVELYNAIVGYEKLSAYAPALLHAIHGASRESPADLVGALQDVVHTDPGPVRAAHAVRDHQHVWTEVNGSGLYRCTCGHEMTYEPTVKSGEQHGA